MEQQLDSYSDDDLCKVEAVVVVVHVDNCGQNDDYRYLWVVVAVVVAAAAAEPERKWLVDDHRNLVLQVVMPLDEHCCHLQQHNYCT